MIAVDTNILVYSHREDSEWYEPAEKCLVRLAEGRSPWAIPWPCIHEFYSVVTHSRIWKAPTPDHGAMQQIDAWLESPTLALLGEAGDHWDRLQALLRSGKVRGSRVHDARIAAICMSHGVRELWSADRDFSRFSELSVLNPLATPS